MDLVRSEGAISGDIVHTVPGKNVWIDVTGVIRWGAQPPTGVQRVENAICRFAASQDDFGFAYFDEKANAFRPVSPAMAAYVDYIVGGNWRSARENYWEGIRTAFAHFGVQSQFMRNETVRRLADALAGHRGRKGILFKVTKVALRSVIWPYVATRRALSLIARIWKSTAPRLAENSIGAGSVLLIAQSAQVEKRPAVMRAVSASRATSVHIIYDIIPILQPDVVSGGYAERMKSFVHWVLEAGEPIITISNAVRDQIVTWNRETLRAGYPHEIKVCPLNSALASDTVKPISEIDGRPFAVFCSTIDIRKGQDMLVAVWAKLVAKLGAEMVPDLALIGRSTTARAAVDAELAKAPHLNGKVHILTGVTDEQLSWAYQNAGLGLFPSMFEGWGLGVSECLAHGLPVVHSDIPVLHEAAQNLMPAAPARDVDAWATLLGDLFANPDKIEALREVVRAEYEPGSPDGFARCVISHLRMIAEHGTGFLELKNTAHI